MENLPLKPLVELSHFGLCAPRRESLRSGVSVKLFAFKAKVGHAVLIGTELETSRLWSRKDFQPEESESLKILTTPTPVWPSARRLWLFVPQTFASVTLGNLSSLTLQQEMIMAIQKGLQRTNLHTFTHGRLQVSSVTRAHHATYTDWMQPFDSRIGSLKCPFAFILADAIVGL